MNGTLASPRAAANTASAQVSGLRYVAILLQTPWLANQRWSRWLVVAASILLLAFATLAACLDHGAHAQLAAMFLYAMDLVLVWACWFSGMALVARDGHQLRMAGVARTATLSALLYAALMLALPAGVAVLAGWDVALCVLAAALAIAIGLGFMLLPRWISVWMSFLPAVYSGLHNLIHFPSPFDPRFQHAAWVVLIVLVVWLINCLLWLVPRGGRALSASTHRSIFLCYLGRWLKIG